ncbi:MAG: DUF1573 domain-containing protein [Cytophagales bacterium]|nr:MAG: DUF1573 domain-containing protein [Cytophagales bacterium]
MANRRISRYIDLFIYIFLGIGIVVFTTRQLYKSQVNNISNYPPTELQLNFDTLINFGQVKSLQVIEFKGFIKNIGQNRLHISNLKTSCGCTNFSMSKLVVNPKDSTMISFTIKPIEKGIGIVTLHFDANTTKLRYNVKATYEAVK